MLGRRIWFSQRVSHSLVAAPLFSAMTHIYGCVFAIGDPQTNEFWSISLLRIFGRSHVSQFF